MKNTGNNPVCDRDEMVKSPVFLLLFSMLRGSKFSSYKYKIEKVTYILVCCFVTLLQISEILDIFLSCSPGI